MPFVRTHLTFVAGFSLRARKGERVRGGSFAMGSAAAALTLVGALFVAPARAVDLPTFNTTSFDGAERPAGVGTGDFNNDGFSDIVVWYSTSTGSPKVTVYFNSPANPGTFLNPLDLPISGTRNSVRAIDINGDGLIDMVVGANANFNAGFWTALGNPPGSPTPLQPPQFHAVTFEGSTGIVNFGDFNHDGWPDILTARRVLLNQGAANPGQFFAPYEIDPGTLAYQYATVGDFNADGWADIAATDDAPNTESLRIYINNGDATFHLLQTIRAFDFSSEPGRQLVSADFNNDGLSDIAVTTAGRASAVYVLIAKPAPAPAPAAPTGEMGSSSNKGGTASSTGLAVADFNLDGVPDMIESGVAPWVLLLGNPPPFSGSGFMTIPLDVGITTGSSFSVADFNGDNKPDIVVVTAAAPFAIKILLNTTVVSGAPCPADLDGDSMVDDADFVVFLAAYNELLCEE